jgi:hypothetical protein
MNLISFEEISDSEIRVTEDGRVSVFDVIKFCGKKNPRDTWTSLCEGYPEVVGKTDNYKFDGKGQRETPVANRKNILYIIGLLKGAIGKAYREDAANLFVAYSEASPELAGSIIDRATPEDLKKIETRLKSKKIRVSFTNVLQDHGVTQGWQFAACTNAIYQPLLGGTAKEVKEQRGLSKSSNLRDDLDEVEMASVMLAEAVAAKKVKSENIQGFVGCRDASADAANRLSQYLNP